MAAINISSKLPKSSAWCLSAQNVYKLYFSQILPFLQQFLLYCVTVYKMNAKKRAVTHQTRTAKIHLIYAAMRTGRTELPSVHPETYFFLTVERILQLERYPGATYMSIQVIKIRNFYTWSDQAAKGEIKGLFYILAEDFVVGWSMGGCGLVAQTGNKQMCTGNKDCKCSKIV